MGTITMVMIMTMITAIATAKVTESRTNVGAAKPPLYLPYAGKE